MANKHRSVDHNCPSRLHTCSLTTVPRLRSSHITRLHVVPRACCLCIVSSLFIISQIPVLSISTVNALWTATILLGFAYGSLFGTMPAIMIEWFGLSVYSPFAHIVPTHDTLAHMSENSEWTLFAPLIGGNIFSIMLGRDLDAHTDASTQVGRTISRAMPSEHQCIVGRECYAFSLRITLVGCAVALGQSTWAGFEMDSVGRLETGESDGIGRLYVSHWHRELHVA